MPSIVPHVRAEAAAQTVVDAASAFPEILPRNCTLHVPPYQKLKSVPNVKVSGAVIAYCSPESTFAVTKRLFDAAKKSILIGIYDFNAPHVKQLLLDALGRGVKVRLMLDIDSKEEQALFDELVSLGVRGAPAPSCASQHNHKYFRSSHEKVIVIDEETVLVQSGNYTTNSCPLNVKDGGDVHAFAPGNRDTGLAMKSKPLAKFFNEVLSADIALEMTGPEDLAAQPVAHQHFLVEKAPSKTPSTLYPSKTFKLAGPLDVQPLLSPDNYMSLLPGLLAKAKSSVLIEQQYIKADQPKVKVLMNAIATAKKKNKKLDVRIVLGKVFNKKDLPKERAMLDTMKKTYGLALGKNIRYVNTDRLVHCHNKMVLVDGVGVLVSSQNWSNAAVSENREAGLWLQHKGLCGYFSAIFETDWKDGLNAPSVGADTVTPQSLQAGGYIRVEPGDYAEV